DGAARGAGRRARGPGPLPGRPRRPRPHRRPVPLGHPGGQRRGVAGARSAARRREPRRRATRPGRGAGHRLLRCADDLQHLRRRERAAGRGRRALAGGGERRSQHRGGAGRRRAGVDPGHGAHL
ncbi:MAG: Fluoride ion transporter CrcB, partial [uncultured Quadrisphaera sp.]